MSNPPPRPQSQFFLGIDGGGSTTRALIGTDDGQFFGYGETGSCNPHELGIAAAREALQAAIARAWSQLAHPAQPFAGAFLGIAGAGSLSTAERVALAEWLPLIPGGNVEVDHDLRIALAGGLSGRPGIAIIAGTGSSGYGRNEQGNTARAGGWGGLIDDAGGGYWLGRHALSAVARAHDGRGESTTLTPAVLDFIHAAQVNQILPWLRRPDIGRPEIAKLAPLVFRSARAGDHCAAALIERGAKELALIAQAIAVRLFPIAKADVVFTGGLSQVVEYRQALSRALHTSAPGVRLLPAENTALTGALILAATKSRGSPSSAWIAKAESFVCAATPGAR